MKTRRESPKITPSLLKFYDKEILRLLMSTFYRRGSEGCDLTFYQYVKVLFDLGFTPGHRIIRIDKTLPWQKGNIMLKNDPVHKKMADITGFYIKNGNKLPKKVIIKMKDKEVL